MTKHFEVKEELSLGLMPMKDRARGCDILEVVKKVCEKFELTMGWLSSLERKKRRIL